VLVSVLVGTFLIFGGVRGPYFTVVTLALAVIAGHIVVGWSQLTGGDAGLLGIAPLHIPTLAGLAPLSGNGSYWLALTLVMGVAGSLAHICSGRYGLLLTAIQDNERRAQALGHHTAGHLLAVFVASAAIAALGGGVYASVVGYVAPDVIGLLLSTQAVVWVAVGGRGTILGPIIATVIVLWLEQKMSSIDTKLWPLAVGSLFILCVFAFPDGLYTGIARFFTRVEKGIGRGTEGAP
jgi:branched-chain amino acid transport system permease protein